MSGSALAQLAETVQRSGLVEAGSRGVALCSGGADSAALLAGLAGWTGPANVVALHVNYGLRPDAGRDEEACADLCGRLGVELVVERAGAPSGGNVQAWARELRYDAAERLRAGRGLEWIAAGHTRTDQAETLLYRLATSPGRRALLGLPARRGALVRPLLELGREQVRELAAAAGLPTRDDPSNALPVFARNRIRNEVMPVLREIGPAAEEVMAETRAELAEESETLGRLASEALESSGAAAAGAIGSEALASMDPAIRRLALRSLAESAAGGPVALGRGRAAEIARLAADPEGGVVELGGGLEARAEHGIVRFALAGPGGDPGEARLTVPGRCRFGSWVVRAELRRGPVIPGDPAEALLDPETLSRTLLVRSWREGDRLRPVGLEGSKSLQDLFTDRKIPRSLRRELPVVTSGDRIAWIAGVAVSEEFAARRGAERAAVLTASSATGI